MDIRVAVRGELRLSAASVSTMLEAITGAPSSLRALAADPRDRLITALAQVGHVGRFDGVRLIVEPAPGEPARWTEAADHLFALLARHADAGSLVASTGGAEIRLDAGRALEPVVAADLPWLEPVDPVGAAPRRAVVSMPEWIRLSAALDERQFTLLAPAGALPPLEDFVASVEPALPGVEAFVANLGGKEMFLGFRRLGDDAMAEASRAVMRRNVAAGGGADELNTAIDSSGLICGVILADDPTMDDARLGYMEALAIAMGATVMDGMGRLIRQ